MLRIAICDDMPEELERLVFLTNQFISAEGLDAEVTKFSHPDGLLHTIEEENFHIYILDIVMPLVNGLELGKEIRRLDREAHIIYATTEPQFALQAYTANPINYLIKPIDKQQLFDTLTLAIARTDLTEEQTFTIKTAEGLRVMKHSEVICCEYRNHAVVFSLINGNEVVSRTIRESYSEYMLPILKDKHFIQCHASFVVNMRRVTGFVRNSFTLIGGKIVPISPKQYTSVRDTYMDYLMAKGYL